MISASTPARASFPARADSVAAARRFARETLAGWGMGELVDDAMLLVSELATNAVVHAGTAFDVTCVDLGQALRVEVYDRHAARGLPAVPPPEGDPTRESGRGLLACAALTSAWGVEYTRAGKTVWCRLDNPHPGNGGAPPGRVPPGSPVIMGIVTVDAESRITGWDGAAEELLGWTADQVMGQRLGELAGPGADLAEGPPASVELRHRDGHLVPLAVTRRAAVPAQGVEPAEPDEPAQPGAPATAWIIARPGDRWLLGEVTVPAGPGGEQPEWATFGRTDLTEQRLSDLLGRAVQGACDTLGGDAAYVVLTDERSVEPYVAAATGLPARVNVAPAALRGVAGRLLRDQLPAVFEDLTASHQGEIALPLLAGTGMRSAVTVPLLVESRLIGQLGVASSTPNRFTNRDAVRIQRAADHLAVSIEGAQLADLARRHRGWLGYLAEASDLLAGTLDPRMTLSMLAQLAVPRLASWCVIRTPDERGEPVTSHVWHEDEAQIDVLAAKVAAAGNDFDELLHGVPGTVTLTVPLQARGHRLGAVTLGRAAGERFDSDVMELAEELCRRAALTLDNALLYRSQVTASQTLQRSLLPARMPAVPGIEVGVAYEAAGEGHEVGGDFYDLFSVGEGRWRFTIGDVCGSGPEAAAVTGLARHALRILGGQGHPVAEVLGELNRAILREHSVGQFLTVLHGEISPKPGGGARIWMVAAGHPLPYVLGPGRRYDVVATPQPLLGVLDDVSYVEDELDLSAGQALLCLTDGVLERRHGRRMLGEDNLDELLLAGAEMSAPAIATALQDAVIDYAPTPPSDDLAVLVLRVTDES